jgi:hypothetical protein
MGWLRRFDTLDQAIATCGVRQTEPLRSPERAVAHRLRNLSSRVGADVGLTFAGLGAFIRPRGRRGLLTFDCRRYELSDVNFRLRRCGGSLRAGQRHRFGGFILAGSLFGSV